MESKIPNEIKILLDELVGNYRMRIGKKLIGIYLHGSLAMGCFNPESSDIDILIVVKEKMSVEEKQVLGSVMVRLSEKSLKNGFDVSIALIDDLKNFKYPTPSEFYFHYDQKEEFSAGTVDFLTQKLDEDLAAHIVITKKQGVCLFGEPIENVFTEIPEKYYLQSIVHDFEWNYDNVMKGADTGTGRVPPYAVLNTCRVLAFIKSGMVTSKAQGGEWGIENLPKEYSPIIQEALNEYLESGKSKLVDLALLKQFIEFANSIVRKT